jgi:hypothetical protein
MSDQDDVKHAPAPPWGIDAPKQDPNDVGADWVPKLQGTGIGSAHVPHDFLGSNAPSDRRQQDEEFERVDRAGAVKRTDSDDPELDPGE